VSAALPAPAAWGRARLRPALVGLGLVAGLGVVWQAALSLFRVPAFVMPAPLTVLAALVDQRLAIVQALLATLGTAVLGLLAAFALAIALAGLFTALPWLARALLPLVIGLRTAPVLAIAPILIMSFGRGIGTGIAVVVIVSFFPIMVNAMQGMAATPRNALELFHVCGAGPLQRFVMLRLPASLPFLFTGLRTAASGAFLAAMLAEWLSGAPGLGSLILDSHAYRELGRLWAAVLVSMAAAFSIFALCSTVERRLTAWRV
jgi:ABC-type nitrate/sulfonate/bicarbonate transport system permease component